MTITGSFDGVVTVAGDRGWVEDAINVNIGDDPEAPPPITLKGRRTAEG